MTPPFEKPRWVRDLERFIPLKSQFVFSENVHDMHASASQDGIVAPVRLDSAVARVFYERSYAHVLRLDLINGVRRLGESGAVQDAADAIRQIGATPPGEQCNPSLEAIRILIRDITSQTSAPVALIINFASRLIVRNDFLDHEEHLLFTQASVSALSATPFPHGDPPETFLNTIVWIVDKEGDLPDWLLVNNPRIRHIPVPKPDHHSRRSLVPQLLLRLMGAREANVEELKAAAQEFVDSTEGLLLTDLWAVTELARHEGITVTRIADAVRHYKVGVTEDPWQRLDREKIRNAADVVGNRVRGQTHAVTHALDIIKRAITGVGGTRRSGRPRGVAFFAGPTGVGKTELAKAITRLLFGDDRAYIRFDMSEFSAEHSDQRLIGAPPGYVGYDVGGELTNAIREKPFSVVLFDEIEKAHPRILDKFLQILDDGVLTSGRGDRVYFSESFIVFTSNLGIYRLRPDGTRELNISPNDDFESVRGKVRTEIDRYFKEVLNRPEILNRIGENIIVFDFIRPRIAVEIFQQMMTVILDELKHNGIEVTLSEAAETALVEACLSDLSHGGRGIRNQLEAYLVNPLARALFDQDAVHGTQWVVSSLTAKGTPSLSLHAG